MQIICEKICGGGVLMVQYFAQINQTTKSILNYYSYILRNA